jgi:hypothetical protein
VAVYVDDMFMAAKVRNGNRSVSARWCHMFADSREELDQMAERIGMKRSWIQNPGTHKEHYDVTEARRAAALAAGAVLLPIGPRWVRFMNARKDALAQAKRSGS